MSILSAISTKQRGGELSDDQIRAVIEGYTSGAIPDYQMSALLMAIYFQGMTFGETCNLTRAMIASGHMVDLSTIPGRKVDKHSTGGVGDKVSLIVAPLVASLGVPVPMISGRGLGHTGGTLDKLESIPGFNTRLSLDQFVRQVAEVGCALIGQTEEIVPADQKLYALRDVTGTVRSLPLITSSILSKKVAEGIDALLLDVKFGSGAFFQDFEEAKILARNLVSVGAELGLEIEALLTDMDQPLGFAVGNWLEVVECLQLLKGEADIPDLRELCLIEAAYMLVLGDKATDIASSRTLAEEALNRGEAYRKFLDLAARQNAEVRYLENPNLYPPAANRLDVTAERSGFITGLDALTIGQATVKLGAGRLLKEDVLDYAAGILLHHKRGDRVERGEPIATLFAQNKERFTSVLPSVQAAIELGDEAPPARPLVWRRITRQGEVDFV